MTAPSPEAMEAAGNIRVVTVMRDLLFRDFAGPQTMGNVARALDAFAAQARADERAKVIAALREPTPAMFAAYDGALKAYIQSVPETDRKWRLRRAMPSGDRGYKIPPREKAKCRFVAMLDASDVRSLASKQGEG